MQLQLLIDTRIISSQKQSILRRLIFALCHILKNNFITKIYSENRPLTSVQPSDTGLHTQNNLSVTQKKRVCTNHLYKSNIILQPLKATSMTELKLIECSSRSNFIQRTLLFGLASRGDLRIQHGVA